MSDTTDTKEKKRSTLPNSLRKQIELDPEVQAKLKNAAEASKKVETVAKSINIAYVTAAASVAGGMAASITRAQVNQLSSAAKMMMECQGRIASISAVSPALLSLSKSLETMQEKFKPVVSTLETRTLVTSKHSQPPQVVNLDTAILQRIAELEEENQELRRKIELLLSRKKADYIK